MVLASLPSSPPSSPPNVAHFPDVRWKVNLPSSTNATMVNLDFFSTLLFLKVIRCTFHPCRGNGVCASGHGHGGQTIRPTDSRRAMSERAGPLSILSIDRSGDNQVKSQLREGGRGRSASERACFLGVSASDARSVARSLRPSPIGSVIPNPVKTAPVFVNGS